MSLKIVIRAPDEMAFDHHTVEAIQEAGMIFSRSHEFIQPRDYVVINHGSSSPISFGPKVTSAIVLNAPDKIKLSVHKKEMYEQVNGLMTKSKKYGPEPILVPTTRFLPRGQQFLEAIDAIGLPAILKPNIGHGGKGAVVVDSPSKLFSMFKQPPTDYILQRYVNASAEYRFNFVNGELVQVSRKMLPPDKEKHPGVFDDWLSLGMATELHKRAHRAAKAIAGAFPLQSLAVDLMRVGTGENPQYYFCEVNSGYGIGPMTAKRLVESVTKQYNEGKLAAFKVK